MAQQTLNIGSNANDGTGDTLRVAMNKVNENFTEVFSAPGITTDALSISGNNNVCNCNRRDNNDCSNRKPCGRRVIALLT